ncbi:hypothetical protein J5X89_18910 [Vibrio sp. G41H]|uniref:hypothetical protein n=1 Tax=unclassified Vibrio TaxID=2614977 RepID=UPI001AD77DDE|nr:MULTISPECIES: hypothetical protein [unclassified Vibrio]MBO7913691.1 hypothetical protein [Vibrio sp. G41H]MCF7492626.1 hypothetical protein [Vibrio sp. G-C-1]
MNKYRELLGLPGIGKSTYIKRSSSDPVLMDRQPTTYKLLMLMVFPFVNPTLFFLIVKPIKWIHFSKYLLYIKGLSRFIIRFNEIKSYDKLGKSNFIFEEGIYQAVWGLLFPLECNLRNRKFACLLLDNIVFSCDVYYLYNSTPVWLNRYNGRNKKTRIDSMLDSKKDTVQIRDWMAFICKYLSNKKVINNIKV